MNQGPFFIPFKDFPKYEHDENSYNRLNNKIERLEKNIRILENRLNKIEKTDNKTIIDEPRDMYMI